MVWVLEKLGQEVVEWFDHVLASVPGHAGAFLRAFVLRRRVKRAGRRILVGTGVEITGHGNIELGDNIQLMKHSSLYAHDGGAIKIGSNFFANSNSCIAAAEGGEITIGDNVLVAMNAVIRAADHTFADTDRPINQQQFSGGRIVIGDDCWICANAVITRDVTIGSHSVVAAGAVVTHDVEPWSVVGGVPARLIRKRRLDETPETWKEPAAALSR
jgi:galactoside O-acetyltransferase